MALKVYDIARVEGISLYLDIEKDFQDFTKRITSITKEDNQPELSRFSRTAISFRGSTGS